MKADPEGRSQERSLPGPRVFVLAEEDQRAGEESIRWSTCRLPGNTRDPKATIATTSCCWRVLLAHGSISRRNCRPSHGTMGEKVETCPARLQCRPFAVSVWGGSCLGSHESTEPPQGPSS